MLYRDVIKKLRHIPPPSQPWLVASALEYAEKLVEWNPMCIKNNALYYQFKTGPSRNDPLLIPDACINILIKCDEKSPSAWVSGIQERAGRIALEPNTLYFGFKPYALTGMKRLGAAAPELNNNTVMLSEVLPVGPELDKLSEAGSLDERVRIFQNYAIAHLVDETYVTSFIEYCAILLCATGGAIRLDELEREVGYSGSHCRGRFKERYGISIKQYSRSLRLQRAALRTVTDKNADFACIAADSGYFDQAHFINEFKSLASMSPYRFRNDIMKLLSMKQ